MEKEAAIQQASKQIESGEVLRVDSNSSQKRDCRQSDRDI